MVYLPVHLGIHLGGKIPGKKVSSIYQLQRSLLQPVISAHLSNICSSTWIIFHQTFGAQKSTNLSKATDRLIFFLLRLSVRFYYFWGLFGVVSAALKGTCSHLVSRTPKATKHVAIISLAVIHPAVQGKVCRSYCNKLSWKMCENFNL